VFDILGHVRDLDAGVVTFGVNLSTGNGDGNFGNNRAFLLAPMTKTFGTYEGVVYGDRNNNNRLDSGEELPTVRVSFSSRANGTAYDQLTDARGRFAFRDVPTGRYGVFFSAPADWVMPFIDTVRVTETGQPVLIRGVRPLSDTLHASLAFQDRTYRVGDLAHVRVTLRNAGRTTIEHIFAWCNGIGDANELNGVGPGWGALGDEHVGVTLRPGQTRTFDVTETVPAGADLYGFVSADCAFTTNFQDGPPFGFDTATIAGKTGPAHGRLVQDANGDGNFDEPVANVRIAVLLPGTHCPVVFAVTGTDGSFELADLPARHYDLHVFGPWRLAEQFPFVFVYSGFDPGQRWFHVTRVGSH
jgi:hypothetical protein